MNEIVKERLDEIKKIASDNGVKEVYLFGSATGETPKRFNPLKSDIDISIVFEKKGHFKGIADIFFNIENELGHLFHPIPVNVGQFENAKKTRFKKLYNKYKKRIV